MNVDDKVANAATDQKFEIITGINEAIDCGDLLKQCSLIAFVSPMWKAIGYGYKISELYKRVIDRADRLIRESEASRFGIRRNLASYRRMVREEANLASLIERLKAAQ